MKDISNGLAKKQGKLIIRGTGACAERLIRQMEKLDKGWLLTVFCFVDYNSKKQGMTFYDKPIISDADIDWTRRDLLYVVAIGNSEHVAREIQARSFFVRGVNLFTYQEYLGLMYRNKLRENEPVKLLLEWEQSNKGWNELLRICHKYGNAEIVMWLYRLFQGKFEGIMPIIEQSGFPVPSHREIKVVGLYIYSYGGGGAERVVSLLIPRLSSAGYKVVLITQINNEANEYALPKGVIRVVISHKMTSNPKEYFTQWREIIRVHELDALCIHLPYEGEVCFLTALFAKLSGLRVIVENHTSCINFVRQRGGLRGHDKMYRILDGLVVLSRMDELFWGAFGCRTCYIPNPCPVLPYKITSQSSNQGRTIIWVGRRNQQYKRICDTILIMRELLKKIPDVRLMIVGDKANDADDAHFFSLLRREGLEPHIEICGWQKDVGKFYDMADVMLFTSPGEGFPMVIAEAMQHALPIVMYELPYLELVRSGRGVIPVRQGDIRGAAKALAEVLYDAEKRNRLSIEALENIREFERWDIDASWKDVLENGGRQPTKQDTVLLPMLLREMSNWQND